MNFIRPYFRAVNTNQYSEWEVNFKKMRNRYENYLISMKDKNMTEEQCNKIWINNYGIIPPKKPNHIYKCEIINPHIKMIVTVIDNENDINKKYRYEIIKFNKVILDTYDKNNIVQVETDIYDLYVESETENMRTYSKVAVNKNDL